MLHAAFICYNSRMLKAWLRFFRVVNLPTVPGDVLVGAAVVAAFACDDPCSAVKFRPLALALACAASCCLYLFGLADNDIVGAETDGSERPIPAGEISMGAARIARALCLLAAVAAGLIGNLPFVWWISSSVQLALEFNYNRTKWACVMGLCRGFNVVCGAAAIAPIRPSESWPFFVAVGVWTIYIAAVTKYSEGEDRDPSKKQCVGSLIGALVYLQLFVLLVSYLHAPTIVTRNLLLAGAGLLVLLRLMKRFLPGVSAS